MSQVQSITLKHRSLPMHSFVPPNFLIPLKRNVSLTPTPNSPSLSVKCYHPKPSSSPPQYPPIGGESLQKVYVGYSIYTLKGVITVAPRPPEFEQKNSGAYAVSREGYVLLQFAPSLGADEVTYDWNQKEVFALSVSEMATLINLGSRDSCEFLHETMKPKSDEYEVRKVLKVEPVLDASGHLISLSVQKKHENENMNEIEKSIFIPVVRAELAVLRSTFNYIMPYLLGWNAFANTIKPEVYNRVNSTNPRYRANDEWNR
ncbi:single-stranded DNA-binding protein WHY1, chloroplastic [Cajanus cajan]|uniref:Single-stranded DNA-binding protein WHY1, chloroplastic n=1 Tax=Cajanus cajan TaxID=3821 RepID=A0A151TFK0_CAJCA|nr:single-stranded DNA-binding protein WHY1, chloroplastic [Cajanus cajan]KYP65835.1 hypothetical protein KK1_012103 [Cajanus cajan]